MNKTVPNASLRMRWVYSTLSKAFLAGTCDLSQITFQDADFYRREKIEFVAGRTVASIDRASRSALTDDGESLQYEHLVLAVGARLRALSVHIGNASGLYHLRTHADAQALRRALDTARQSSWSARAFSDWNSRQSLRPKGSKSLWWKHRNSP